MKNSPKHLENRNTISLIRLLVGWFLQLIYHQFSWAYDLVAWTVSLGRWKAWVYSVIPYLHASTILELGHGPGYLLLALSQAGKHCIGLDLSKQMGTKAMRKLRHHNLSPSIIRARSQQLPFTHDSIPQVVTTFPSEYIGEADTLTEIYRILVPGGSATILLAAWITGKKVLDRLAAWLFNVTGESLVWKDHFLDPARSIGFSAQSEYIFFPTSKLLLVHLTKPEEP